MVAASLVAQLAARAWVRLVFLSSLAAGLLQPGLGAQPHPSHWDWPLTQLIHGSELRSRGKAATLIALETPPGLVANTSRTRLSTPSHRG